MSTGKIAVQVAHAAVELAVRGLKKNDAIVNKWLIEGQKKVVVRIKSIEELQNTSDVAKRTGIPYAIIADRGLTEVEPGTITCIGVGPEKEELIDKVTGSLPLL
jgi:PTH2 family peptidyl-tRNA hydrolase